MTDQSKAATTPESRGFQQLAPTAGVTLSTVSGAVDGPLAQGITMHQARGVRVMVQDQARASAPDLFPQLSQPPGGIGAAAQPPDHTAPTSATPVRPRPSAPPAMPYDRAPGQLQGPDATC